MEIYDLELEKVINRIKEEKAKLVCIQLPDGLKSQADYIQKKIKEETKANVLIWLGTNFGACDVPHGLNKLNVDLLISFGHNLFHWLVQNLAEFGQGPTQVAVGDNAGEATLFVHHQGGPQTFGPHLPDGQGQGLFRPGAGNFVPR